MNELPHAHGGPPLRGRLRTIADDFLVEETLGFAPDGTGEHAMLSIEKRDANTEWVARRLAEAAGVAPMAIGYSGLKDRHAVTRQSFTVHLPGRPDPDWKGLSIEGVRILEVSRHTRKLKRGVHRSNRFRIRLREISGSRDEAEARLGQLRDLGAPNYFGEQRFGRDGENLRSALALFGGARLGRSQRNFALSAARSQLFNAVLARRVLESSWNQALDGEVFMLAGTHSIFGPQDIDQQLLERMQRLDIDPTAPLWGRGELRCSGKVAQIERQIAARESVLAAGLEAADLSQERRSTRLRAADLEHEWLEDGSLCLSFSLGPGGYATSLLREVCAT